MYNNLINFVIVFDNAVKKGLLLLLSIIVAIITSNSCLSEVYHNFLGQILSISVNNHYFSLSNQAWINDFLMSVFFFVVALDIKRETLNGYLKKKNQRLFPVVAATVGVILPIVIYIIFNFNDKETIKGWAIPAATDIAFALGIYSFLAKNLPSSLRVFLAALAIIDDLISIVIIIVFYNKNLNLNFMGLILLCVLILFLFNRIGIKQILFYIIIGLGLWYLFFKSNLNMTASSIILVFFIPLKDIKNKVFLEKYMVFYIEYLILPLFAFANCDICISDFNIHLCTNKVILGISLGLFFGKTLGIFLTSYFFKSLKIIIFERNVNLFHFLFISSLCGIGFTMSVFISITAFRDVNSLVKLAKIGIVIGSFLSLFFSVLITIFINKKVNNVNKI